MTIIKPLQQIFQSPLKFFLILIITLFSILGILALTAIYNYNFNNNYNIGIMDIRTQYMFALSQKITRDVYPLFEKNYNERYSNNKDRGEFCYSFFGDEVKEKKIKLSLDEQKIRGVVHMDGNSYSAKINPKTLELEINNSPSTWHWKWYNWLGIGLQKIHKQTIEEIASSPLPVRSGTE